jgi:hypothetical protein
VDTGGGAVLVVDGEALRASNLTLPAARCPLPAARCPLPAAGGWGVIHLHEATPHAGSEWTDDGTQRDQRQLKGCARGERAPFQPLPS